MDHLRKEVSLIDWKLTLDTDTKRRQPLRPQKLTMSQETHSLTLHVLAKRRKALAALLKRDDDEVNEELVKNGLYFLPPDD